MLRPKPEIVLLNACKSFDEQLKTFIKNARNDPKAVHAAAQVLFDVRRLENALFTDEDPSTIIP